MNTIQTPVPIEESDPEFAKLLKWWYESGITRHPIDDTPPPTPITVPKAIKRNDPCPCGSGKKYKKCCIRKG